jgi:3-methyladenine DNA glycosylase AlkD
MNDTADEITRALRALGTDTRESNRTSLHEDLGVFTPDLRKVVRAYKPRLQEVEGADVYELCLALIDKNILECRQVAYELIGGHKGARAHLTPARIEALGRGMDNWDSVDLFCTHIAGRAWREGHLPDSTVRGWAVSQNLWWRRAAVACTVALNTKSRGGTGDAERTLEICQIVVADPEVMVQKAISWALRHLVRWDPAAVIWFLSENEDTVSALVRREVTKKLQTGRKNG